MESTENLESRSSTIETKKFEREYWQRYGEEIGDTALPHYCVPAKEILGKLRKKKVYLKPYSNMTNEEAEAYLENEIRPWIRSKLANYNQAVLRTLNKKDMEVRAFSKKRTQRR